MSNRLSELYALAWPTARVGEALETLAHKAHIRSHALPSVTLTSSIPPTDRIALADWIGLAATQLGIEAEAVTTTYAEVDLLVQGCAPALLYLTPLETPLNHGTLSTNEHDLALPHAGRLLVLLRSNAQRVCVIAPDLTLRHVASRTVRDALCVPLETPWVDSVDRLLRAADVAEERLQRVRSVIIGEQLSATQIAGGWLLRLSPGARIGQQIRHARLLWPLLAMGGAIVVLQALLVATWWVIGRHVLSGKLDWAWLWAWGLLLLTAIPFQMLVQWSQGIFATGLGSIFKQRLLYGILKLHPEEIRHQGIGQFLVQVMSAGSVETLALNGGLTALVSVFQLITAMIVLGIGAGGWIHALLLGVCVGMTVLLGIRNTRQQLTRSVVYLEMTNAIIERMVGHSTRLIQEDPAQWHTDEDRDVDRYLQQSSRSDFSAQVLLAMPSCWLAVGLSGVVPAIMGGSASPAVLAISMGGVVLAWQSLLRVVQGMQSVTDVVISWRRVAPLFGAVARAEERPAMVAEPASASTAATFSQPLLIARDLAYRYHNRGSAVLQGCTLQVAPTDRILLEGPSGGGKSTLAAVLAGLRTPETGLLLLWGYDRPSIGAAAWRRRVAVAPQFHENHVFSDTFAFNLLMGRRWPPEEQDLAEATTICRELGLGELLRRMPSGLLQIVGENGWQLSHGERSRLYIARALLQHADMIIMDESFGALDPETLHLALACALRRAPALLVIAHP